ncbi:Adenosine 5'-monophosphoramidase, partial [Ascosphaera acerosa]
EIPSFKLYESSKVFAFLDIQPTTKGHALVIPKFCGEKLTDVPDDYLAELLPVAKKIASAVGVPDYNILQNNGEIAHQVVKHVHVHMIPKPNKEEGLVVGWPQINSSMDDLKKLHEEIVAKL